MGSFRELRSLFVRTPTHPDKVPHVVSMGNGCISHQISQVGRVAFVRGVLVVAAASGAAVMES